jgi:hypothetical protein
MERLFAEVPESVPNTEAVAEMCDLTIPFPKGSERYPKYPLPPEVKTDRAGYLKRALHRRPEDPLRRRLAAAPGSAADPAARRGPRRPARLRARGHREDGLHRLLPRRLGLHRLGEEAGHPGRARAAARAPAASSPTCSGSPTSTPALQAALRALPQPRARLAAGLRHRLLHAPARRGDRLRAPKYGDACVANIITYGTWGPRW